MRQYNRAGENLFVDYAGHTAAVVNQNTGEIRDDHILVAMPAVSNYTYVEAIWTQGLQDWIGSHQRTFTFLGGVPEIVIQIFCAQASAKRIAMPCYQHHLPGVRRSHDGIATILAWVRRPKNTAKAEDGVLIVERCILAALSNWTFLSLLELNQTISNPPEQLNTQPFKKLICCRQETFSSLNQPALRVLPATPYTFAWWKKIRIHIDYHIEFEGLYYSVPYQPAKNPFRLPVKLKQNAVSRRSTIAIPMDWIRC